MKREIFRVIAVASAAIFVASFSNCKKDDVLSSAADSSTLAVTKNTDKTSVVSDSFVVSTVVKFVSDKGISRVATGEDGTLYATASKSNEVYRVKGSTVSLFAKVAGHPFGIKVGKNGDVFVMCKDATRGIARFSSDGRILPAIQTSQELYQPTDMAVLDDGTAYITDSYHHRIIKVTPDGTSTVIAGNGYPGTMDGIGAAVRLTNPTSIKYGGDGFIYFVDGRSFGPNSGAFEPGRYIRRINQYGRVSTVFKALDDVQILDFALAKKDNYFNPTPETNIFVTNTNNTIGFVQTTGGEQRMLGPHGNGYTDGLLKYAQFHYPYGISIKGDVMYIADYENNAIRRVVRK
ncbi:hypothetical protein GS399_09615 [Pedobacter sp. HMF7647]|uniref:6-bladed beta-propeller n=1 Tax=Hufsiella arboris TaxID=2695275 RepID=A0A7K1Y9G7_9SPHI|nr:hypothetical protein [Hufsiella arboris]MXV51225.1 hypothetical protein [Hufsiella arboris]